MTDTKTNEDLREKILAECIDGDYTLFDFQVRDVFNAMDQYFSTRAKQMLEWMAKNVEDIEPGHQDGMHFYYKGEWITAEQLFQNFL